MTAITLELHVPNLDVASSFYGALGFEIAWRDSRPGSQYLVMRLDDTPIAFDAWEKPHGYFGRDDGERGRGVEVVISVSDIEQTYRQASELDAVVAPLRQRPWGLRDFRVADPFGYYLRFTEPGDLLANDYGGRPA